MLNTALSILAAIALLMPGFIVAELSVVRSVRPRRNDLELALLMLSYTLVVQLAFSVWTAHLIESIGSPDYWPNHVGAISLYVAVVLLGVPIALGVVLNRYLTSVEAKEGPPNLFAARLGGGEAKDAFEYTYRRWRREGGYVIVELVGHSRGNPRLVGGVYGQRSAAGMTPSSHDIYLEALFMVTEDERGIRNVTSRADPERGVYIAAEQIARIDLVPEEQARIAA
jgi:hypothetical protein